MGHLDAEREVVHYRSPCLRLCFSCSKLFVGYLAVLEVVAHALYAPADMRSELVREDPELRQRLEQQAINADVLYKTHIKGVYADLLEFMGPILGE